MLHLLIILTRWFYDLLSVGTIPDQTLVARNRDWRCFTTPTLDVWKLDWEIMRECIQVAATVIASLGYLIVQSSDYVGQIDGVEPTQRSLSRRQRLQFGVHTELYGRFFTLGRCDGCALCQVYHL